MIIYTATGGETLSQLASEHGVSPVNLAADNGLSPDDTLLVGQAVVIQIPDMVYVVKEGDTLSAIAREFGTSALNLLRNNFRLGGIDRINPGDEIIISYKDENKRKTFATNSYAYPYIEKSLLREHMPYLTYFAPFTYGITENGGLVNLNDTGLLTVAKEYGVNPLLHLSTLTEGGGFSSSRASLVFDDGMARNRLISEIIETIEQKGYMGADVDFEFINPSEKFDYITFLQDIRLALEPLGYPLFSALAPKTSDDQRGTLYEGHDYSGIGAAVNYVLLMTYEWGYTYGPPMAVAPLPAVRRVCEYAKTRISASKIFMGIPTYGYDWTLPYIKGSGKGAPSISPIEAVNIAKRFNANIQYDESAQSPWFNYTDDDGNLHEVWFEDARSISAKLKLAEELNFYGIGYWNSMRRFPQNWVVLNGNYNILNLSLI